jgi:hypothetical protein
VSIHNAAGLVYCVVCLTVIDDLEERMGSVFTGCQNMEAVYPDQSLSTPQSDCLVP